MARQPRKAQTQKTPGIMGNLIRQLGSLAGGSLGTIVGMPVTGASTGHSLGASLSKWLGAGDYQVSSNSLVTKASTGVPMMHNTGQSITIRHRELVTQVNGQSSFVVQTGLPLNPGFSSTFPWLSTVAASFQEYEFKGLVFHYIPTSGSIVSGTNPALGSVMLQTTYRASDVAPTSKVAMLNEYWAGEVVPSDALAHPIECDPKENPFNVKYVRNGSVPVGDSILLYDVGTTYLATSGLQSATPVPVGDLWVTYEVVLRKPILTSNTTFGSYAAAEFGSSASSNLFSGLVGTAGSLPVTFAASNVVNIGTGASGLFQITVSIFNLPTNNFLISGGFATLLTSGPTNATLVVPFGTIPAIYSTNCNAGSGVNQMTTTFYVYKSDATLISSMQIPLPTFTGTYTNCSITVSQWR